MIKEKQLLLDEVKNQFSQFDSFVIIRYLKLNANKANQFRREVEQKEGSVRVTSKRLMVKAAEAAGINLDLANLPGHIAMVFTGKDPIETTKLVFKFSQETEKAVEVLGGRFEGQLYNAAKVEMLSKLPGKNEMRAQFLATLEAPMAQTLAVIEAVLTSVIYCLDNKCKQVEEVDIKNPEEDEVV